MTSYIRVIACHTRVSMEFTWSPVLGNCKPQCFHTRTCQKHPLIYSRSLPDRALHTRPPTHSLCRPSVWEAPPADSSLSFDAHCCCHTLRKHPCVGRFYKFEGSPNLYLCRNWVPKSAALRRWYIYELRLGGKWHRVPPSVECWLCLAPTVASGLTIGSLLHVFPLL